MKSILRYKSLVAILLATFLLACQDEEYPLTKDLYNESTEVLKIALDDKYKEFSADEHFISATFEGNFWWNAEVKLINSEGDYETENWFSITPMRNFGTREINLYLSQNVEKNHDRQVEITFTSDDGSYSNTLTIVQKACKPFVDISQTEKSFSILGGKLNISVNASDQWKFTDLPAWIHASYDQEQAFKKGKNVVLTFDVDPYQGADLEEDRVFEIIFESIEEGSTTQKQTLRISQALMAKSPDGVSITNGEDLPVSWNSVAGAIYYDVLAYDLSGNLVGTKRYEPDNPEQPTQSCSISDMDWGTFVGKIDVTVKGYLSENVWRESPKGKALSHNYFSNDSGDGSDSNQEVLRIYNLRHLENVHHSLASGRFLYYKQMSNLDLSFYTNNTYSPIGSVTMPFKGSFNGNGFKLRSLVYNNSRKILYNDASFYYGVFGVVDASAEEPTQIFNISIENFNIKAEDASTAALDINKNYCGVSFLAGRVNGGAIIENCTVKDSPLIGGGATSRNYTGGFVGLSDYAIIRNCSIQGGNITSARSGTLGGIVGQSINAATVIENCVNKIDYFNTTTSVTYGGILGRGVGTIRNCANYADMRMSMYTGGILGDGNYYLEGTSLKAGVVTIEDCINYGHYQETDKIGPIDNANGASASGGIAGKTSSANNSISRCANYGKLVNHIYNRTNADNQSTYYGGIIGNAARVTITDCVNYADITGGVVNNTTSNTRVYNAGGIAGRMDNHSRSKIINSFNTGAVIYTSTGSNTASTTLNIGALCGLFEATPSSTTIVESFALSGIQNSTNKLLGTKELNADNTASFKTESELKSSNTFINWDPSVWFIIEGSYPVLKGIQNN